MNGFLKINFKYFQELAPTKAHVVGNRKESFVALLEDVVVHMAIKYVNVYIKNFAEKLSVKCRILFVLYHNKIATQS